jgi:membrane-associated phospholipid phosphatase
VLLALFGLLLAAVQAGWAPLHRLDVRAAVDLHRQLLGSAGQRDWWRLVSDVLHPDVLRVVAALAAVFLWLRARPTAAVFVVASFAGAAVLEVVVKAAVGRPRPVWAHPVAQASGASFPSGHALTSFVAAGVLVLLVPRHRVPVGVAGAVAVVLVGWSRIALGVHYVSDVLAGWLLGAAWLTCLAAWPGRRPVRVSRR